MLLFRAKVSEKLRGRRGLINILKKAPKYEKHDRAWWHRFIDEHW